MFVKFRVKANAIRRTLTAYIQNTCMKTFYDFHAGVSINFIVSLADNSLRLVPSTT